MPIPALAWGLLSVHHSIWYPVNLLAGMVLPGVGAMNLDEFHLSLFITGVVIHVSMCLAIGLMLGVMLPTLPNVPKSLAWGGLLMPLLWSAVSFVLMGIVNPLLGRHVEWPWFILSQFAFGVGAAAVIANTWKLGPVLSGLLGGAAGGVFMSIPALLWSLSTGRGIWYPVNLLAGLVVPDMPTAETALQSIPRRVVLPGRDDSRRHVGDVSAWPMPWRCRSCGRFPPRSSGAPCFCRSCGRGPATDSWASSTRFSSRGWIGPGSSCRSLSLVWRWRRWWSVRKRSKCRRLALVHTCRPIRPSAEGRFGREPIVH